MRKGDDERQGFAKCWDRKLAADMSVRAESDISNIYFVDIDSRLIAFEVDGATTLWSTDLGGSVVSNILVTDDSIIVATARKEGGTSTGAVLRSVSKQTGITSWFITLPDSDPITIGAVNGSLIGISSAGAVSSFDYATGEKKWTRLIGGKTTTPPFFSDDAVFVGTDRNQVLEIAAATGNSTAIAKSVGAPSVVYRDESGRILVGDDRGNLVLVSADGKRIWKFRNGARIADLSHYDSEFLAASDDNFVYKISRAGNVEWKRRLSSRIDGRTLVIGDVAVFTTIGDGYVYVIDLTNGKILNRFENGENNPAQAIGARKGFLMLTQNELALFGGTCPQNKKTAP